MTDIEAIEPTSDTYLIVKISEPKDMRFSRDLGLIRKVIHETHVATTEIVLRSASKQNVYGLDQTDDLIAVSEIVDRHIAHAKDALRARRQYMAFEDRVAEAQRVEDNAAAKEDRPVRFIKNFRIWIEGYAATGESGGATSHMIYGFDINDALERWRDRDSPEANRFLQYSPEGPDMFSSYTGWTYWGCKIFTDEADARKSFG